jgi:hypothetical protein
MFTRTLTKHATQYIIKIPLTMNIQVTITVHRACRQLVADFVAKKQRAEFSHRSERSDKKALPVQPEGPNLGARPADASLAHGH